MSADQLDQLDHASLLRIEIQTLFGWTRDGRLQVPHHLVLAVRGDRSASFAPGPDLPDALVGELSDRLNSAGPEATVELARRRLTELGLPPVVSSGPSYLVPRDLRHDSPVEVVRSDTADVAALRTANPGNWSEHEWTHLLSGEHGPWAVVVRDGLAVSLAHVPVSSPIAAEVGVWTHPEHRGQRYAAAVTAALASIVTSTGRRLFYSTSSDNHASQRVAAGLGLRPIGSLWQVSPPDMAGLHLGDL